MSHDPSEIILIWSFGAQETYRVKNICASQTVETNTCFKICYDMMIRKERPLFEI